MKLDSITIIGREFESTTRGKGIGLNEKLKLSEVSGKKLKKEITKITNSLSQIIEQNEVTVNNFTLDEIAIKLEVSASGKIAILGNGVSTSGTGGIELKFKRTSS